MKYNIQKNLSLFVPDYNVMRYFFLISYNSSNDFDWNYFTAPHYIFSSFLVWRKNIHVRGEQTFIFSNSSTQSNWHETHSRDLYVKCNVHQCGENEEKCGAFQARKNSSYWKEKRERKFSTWKMRENVEKNVVYHLLERMSSRFYSRAFGTADWMHWRYFFLDKWTKCHIDFRPK